MKRNLIYLILFLTVLILAGLLLFRFRQYDLISIGIALLSCIPFFAGFEKRKPSPRELVLVAILTASVVVGRIVFSPIPSFQPVSAFIIIIAVVFGNEMGFMVGALSAILSNFYFGQGAWTPFQMFAWGLIGFIAGAMKNYSWFKNYFVLIAFGILTGILYSLILDMQTILFLDNGVNLTRYLAAVAASFPIMLIYIISNTVFLAALSLPVIRILERIKNKYGLYR